MQVLFKSKDTNTLRLEEFMTVYREGNRVVLAVPDECISLCCSYMDNEDYESRLKDAVAGRTNGVDFSDYSFEKYNRASVEDNEDYEYVF